MICTIFFVVLFKSFYKKEEEKEINVLLKQRKDGIFILDKFAVFKIQLQKHLKYLVINI